MKREHVEWLLDWEARARHPASLAWLMNLHPSIAPPCRLLVQHAVREGRFTPRDFALSCPSPFDSDCRVEPWLAALISACDGRKTVRDHLAEARRTGQMATGYRDADFAAIIVSMVSAGILNRTEPRP